MTWEVIAKTPVHELAEELGVRTPAGHALDGHTVAAAKPSQSRAA